VVFDELAVGVLVDVDADGDDGDSLGLHAALHFDEGGDFFDAGSAPGGPEVEDDDLSAKLAEGDFVLGVLNGEVGCGGADVGRARSGVAGGKSEKGDEGGGTSETVHTDIIINSPGERSRFLGAKAPRNDNTFLGRGNGVGKKQIPRR